MVKCFTNKSTGTTVCPSSRGMKGKFKSSKIKGMKKRVRGTGPSMKKKAGRPKGRKDKVKRKTRSDAGMKTYKKIPQARALVNRIKLKPKPIKRKIKRKKKPKKRIIKRTKAVSDCRKKIKMAVKRAMKKRIV